VHLREYNRLGENAGPIALKTEFFSFFALAPVFAPTPLWKLISTAELENTDSLAGYLTSA
jgi:hypothetical protein